MPKAIILAAGLGSRFQALTKNFHKSLFQIDGVPNLVRTIRYLQEAGIREIVVVTGHNSHLLEETVVPLDVKTIYNPHYKDKNNMYSFALAKEYFADSWVIDADVVLFENVFKETPKKATELVIVRQNASPEWVVRADAMGKINKIDVTLEQAPSLLGVSYWPKYEADAITKAISEKSSGAFDCSGGYWCDVSRDLLEQGVIEVYAKLLPNGLADELDNVEDYERVCSKL